MKKNKFSKALKHLKSKKLDEKIKKLDEAAPTNNMSGVYQQSPRSGVGFRLGPPDPARTFVAAADGSWPAGIPGTAGEPYYTRPPDHWTGTVDWETITTPEFGFDAAQGNNTDGLIDPVTNVVKTQLPPGSRGFILGPLVDGFVPNHVSDAFTRIGYIEKDTRQFVLLGIIQGEWFAGLNEVSGAFGNRTHPVFNGQANQFTQVNPSFTLDMALWFRNEMLKNRFVKNVSYNAVGGIPQQGNPDPDAPQNLGGNGVGGGSGAAGSNPDGSGTGHGSGGEPDIGTPQGDPDDGKDPGENDLWGMTQAEARAKYGGMSDEELAELGIVRMPNGEFRAMTEEEKRQYEEKKKKEKFEEMMKELDKDIKKYSALQKQYEKEARDILIKFGIDVALTLFGGAILKGVLGGLTRIPSAIRFLQNLTKAKKVVKGADMLSDLGYASKATSVAKKAAASADDLSAAADDLGNKFFSTLMMSSDPKAKSAALAINRAMESGKDDLVYAAIEKAKVTVMGYAPKVTKTATIPKIPMIKNIKIKPEFLKKSGQSFDLGAYGLEDIGVDQFKKVLTNPSAFNIRPGTAKWKKVMQYAKDYLIEFKLYGDGQELLIELDEPIENILIEDRITIRENKKRILREIRQPLREIKQLPKTEKLKGYRPNFKGKYSPQNTPDVTASKRSDQLVMAKNAEGQAWTVGDKYQKGWETTGRMNHVYSRVGESDKFFEQITANNSTDVERKMQEHLNHVYHNKAMLKIDSNYKSPFVIDEQETFDNKINDPLFTKVAKRLKNEIDYPKKPAKAGYPNEAPPKIDPNTGMHPKFGKRYKYDKLDPHSAKTMAGAPTGDPEIDANVKKAAKVKEDWRSDLKNLWLGSERKEWKKKIEEDYVNTTQGMKVGQTFTHVPSGQTVTTSGVLGGIETLQTSVPIFGDEIPGPSESQYGLQGFAKPIDIMRRGKKKTEELNKELDSSEDYTKEIKADKFMKGRVEDSVDSALLSDLGYKSTEDILAEVGDLWTYEEYMAMLDAIADKAAAKSLPITNKILEYSPTGKTPGDVPISLIDAQEAITNARNKAEQALHQAWERYNKVPDLPDGGEEPIAKSRRSNYTSQEIAQNRENLKNSIITTATGVIDGARNLNRVNYALNLAKRQSVKSGGSTQITTIPPDSLGGKNNPVETKMHFQSKKAFIKSVDLNNTDYDIASQIVNNSADAAQYALGFKAVHSQIPTEGGSQENNVKLNSKGDLEMFDNYAFRPDGYENFEAPVPIVGLIPGVPKIPVGKIAGKVDDKLGTEFQKDLATQIDKAGPVGWLSHALLGDIPDRQDPAVRIKTTITKKELIKILGAADYKIFVNRMNKEKKKRKVNESNTFSKIKKFKNKY